MKKLIHNYGIFLLLALFLVFGVIIIIGFDGTGERGSGDSILHYLYAKHALTMPELLLNHWAKPLFTLCAMSFAQFGIIGMKVFNLIISALTILFTYKTAQKLDIKLPIIVGLILFFTPLFLALTFSGLTEPLFAFALMLGIYLAIDNKMLSASIVLSFLPFIRSEGLILIGVFALFLLLKKHWKYIPLLLTGHIIYSIVGSFYYSDILWVFTKIPYAKMSSTYGDGGLFHFTHQLFYVIGAPIYVLLIAGLLVILYRIIKVKNYLWSTTSILIMGSFAAFFVAHSLFWYLGIFNSMGLKRVLICVAPQISIIALIGFNGLTENTFFKSIILKRSLQTFLVLAILIFPFSGNKAGIDFEKDFELSPSQKSAIDATSYISTLKGENSTFVFSDPYLAEQLDINYFDKNIRVELSFDKIHEVNSNEIIIWDSWFSIVENGISQETIENVVELKKVKTFSTQDGGTSYIVFVKK